MSDVSYEPKIHGDVVLEYEDVPSTGWKYKLTAYGTVFRQENGGEWRKFYDVMSWAVGAHVALVRRAKFQTITADNWDGPVPAQPEVTVRDLQKNTYKTNSGKELTDKDLQILAKEAEEGYDPATIKEVPPEKRVSGKGRKETPVAATKEKAKPKAAPKKEAADKPQKLGARANKILEMELGLTTKQKEEVRAKADAISRERVLPTGKNDRLTRVWDIYEAAGVDLPANLATEKAEFMKTGVLPRSSGNGNGDPKETQGGKNAASTTQKKQTSGKRQSTPATKPANDGQPSAEADDQSESKDEPPTSESSASETETL